LPKVALVFAGGPAPGANAVISACASAFSRADWQVLGIRHGFADLMARPRDEALVAGQDYMVIEPRLLRGLRNRRGVLFGTSRSAPGGEITKPEDLANPALCAGLELVVGRLLELGVQALVTIGGDGTLRTAYLLHRFQAENPAFQRRGGAVKVRVVHVPKTIDNDYRGIDFTFGFFTAVDILAKELLDLRADAVATRTTFIVEVMGRRAGWLAYGAGIAGEAHLVIAPEDIRGELAAAEDGRTVLDIDALVEHIAAVIAQRHRQGKAYAVIVLAEGLVDHLPRRLTAGMQRDGAGLVSLREFKLGPYVTGRVTERLRELDAAHIRVRDVSLGYEARSAAPHAFDVVLGTQLGRGAFDVVAGSDRSGVMVSVKGQLQRAVIAMDELVDPVSLRPATRFVPEDSDFRALAHELGTQRSTPAPDTP